MTHLCHAGMKINVDVNSKSSFSITVQLKNSIRKVKIIIYEKLHIPGTMQMLRLTTKETLEDDKTIEAYNIKENDTICLVPQGEALLKCYEKFIAIFSFIYLRTFTFISIHVNYNVANTLKVQNYV